MRKYLPSIVLYIFIFSQIRPSLAQTLPGIREALEQRNWQEVEEQIIVVARLIENFANKLNEMMEMMEEVVAKK